MKKILVVFDGAHFPSSTLDFALKLNEESPILLTGIFLPSVDYAEAMRYYYYGAALAPLYLTEYDDDPVAIQHNISRFEAFCTDHHIRFRIHDNIKKQVVAGLQSETRYADLLVMSSIHFYENLGEMIQEEYLVDTLHKAECPVLLLPGDFAMPRSVILAYDGSASSMFAMKQFIYLMPFLSDLETIIVYADDKDGDIPFLDQVKEYAAHHFNALGFYKLAADPKKYLSTWLADRGPCLLVSGSFGRPAVSEWFHRNFLADVIKEHAIPVFTAHL